MQQGLSLIGRVSIRTIETKGKIILHVCQRAYDCPMFYSLVSQYGQSYAIPLIYERKRININVGEFIEKKCIRKLKDGETEEYSQYYQILNISGNELCVISFAGSPLPVETKYEIEQIQKEYFMIILDNYHVEYVYRTFINDKNLTCQRLIGTRYTWDDKSVVIPIKRYYYSGFGVLKKMPDDF